MQYGHDDVGLAVVGTPGYGVGRTAGCEVAGVGKTAAVEGAGRVSAAASDLPDKPAKHGRIASLTFQLQLWESSDSIGFEEPGTWLYPW